MLHTYRLPIILILFALLQGCANHQLNYTLEVKDWAEKALPDTAEISYSVFLVGDAGYGSADWQPPALKALGEALEEAPENSAVIYLGDNLYPDGFPSKGAVEERALDEIHLNHQLDILKDYEGRSFFVAGNHDWYQYGVEGVRRQANYIKNYTDGETRLLPKPGCGDPVEVELTDDITLILLDSQWWLSDWENETTINSGCEAKSRADFAFLLREAIKSNSRKEIIIALHHPPFSSGHHGGNFTFSEHLFPLRDVNDNLYIPFPIVGNFFRFLQASIGSRQDVANASYRDLRNLLLQEAHLTDSIIFASGHEHSMQYWERDNNYFIVSGAGSKRTAARNGSGGSLFAYGGYGYSKVDYYDNGQVWVTYYQTEEGEEPKVAFRHLIKEKGATLEEEPVHYPNEFSEDRNRTLTVSEKDFSRKGLGQTIWGDHYRSSYSSEITVPELDLLAEGLRPIKRGGGFQTNSLRLENNNEQQYTLRSVNKDASRTVPYPLNTNLVLDVVADNFSASHPLAAIAVAPLADLAGIYHTNPSIVYLPQQEGLGEYNEFYANKLFLFEERPDNKGWKDADNFGNPDDIVSTSEMLENTREQHDDRIDQQWTVQSRLFDIIIGDWDRHDDQWRWAKIDQGKNEIYRPIPRDRDQAFSNYDGPAIAMARFFSPKSKQWRPYTDNLGAEIQWATYNAYLFDQSFLTEMEWGDWKIAVDSLQNSLIDESIDSIFQAVWPEPFLSRDAPEIIETIKGRRDKLEEIAKEYYLFLAQKVDVLGTDQKDLFVIERLDNDRTQIRVYDTNKDGERESLFYDRIFSNKETKEVRCYGLNDEDIFEVRGEVNTGVLVHLIGGEDNDVFDDQSVTKMAGKQIVIHDFKSENNELIATNDSKDSRNDKAHHNLYNRRGPAYNYNFNFVAPFLGFNPDDKLYIGFRGNYTTYGFRKKPFAAKHNYGALVSLSTGGSRVYYSCDLKNIFGRWGIRFGAFLQTPLYASNYYGLGNNTLNEEDAFGDNYYSLRQRKIELHTAMVWKPNSQFEFYFGPKITRYHIERTPGRFIDQIGDEINEDIFEGLNLVTMDVGMIYRNVDQNTFPTRGMDFRAFTGYTHQFDDTDGFSFPYFDAKLALYQNLNSKGTFVIASRLGYQHRFSENVPFFLGATLGGLGDNGNIRGFNRNRFTGKTALYHNTDIRWKLFNWSNPVIPMSVGITGSFDYGKVSLDDIKNDTWHYSYGGGLFLVPFDLLTIHAGAYLAPDDDDFQIQVGGEFFF